MLTLAKALRLSPLSCVAFVGAGGKTTAMFQLARQLLQADSPSISPPLNVVVTASAHLGSWQTSLADRHIVAGEGGPIQELEELQPGVILISGPQVGDKLEPLSNITMDWLREKCGELALPLLIEADGSRQKPLKAPAEHEPPIPTWVDMVVVMVGLSALDQPLNEEWVHRSQKFQQLSGANINDRITTDMLAHVLTHSQGGLKDIPANARRLALLNQADTAELQSKAHTLAKKLLSAFEAVLITSLQREQVYLKIQSVAGIVLAAGESQRFGPPKQLLDWRGEPFVRAVARTALNAGLDPVLVVSGAESERVEGAVSDLPLQVVHNPLWQSGQSSSIQAGIRALPPESGAAIFLLADQPQVTQTILRALVERHATDQPAILAPLIVDRRGNPVLFDRVTFPDLLALKGDIGGRAIFSKHEVEYLPWHDDGLLIDVDTPEMYQRLKDQLE